MQEIRLTPTSHIVLGLLSLAGQASPYELKRMVSVGVGNFWSLQHAQLYTEPQRLAAAGYLTEDQESGGRRRKRYALTARGKGALEGWLAAPTTGFTELRDLGLLKLFFGADPAVVAKAQLQVHQDKLAEYSELHRTQGGSMPQGPRLALEAGIGHEREWVGFWRKLTR